MLKYHSKPKDGEVHGIENLLSTFNLAPHGMLLSKSECILNLQEGFIHEWEKQLWSDTRKMGEKKLRSYREFKRTFARENYYTYPRLPSGPTE